jgi:hypothetical protein
MVTETEEVTAARSTGAVVDGWRNELLGETAHSRARP